MAIGSTGGEGSPHNLLQLFVAQVKLWQGLDERTAQRFSSISRSGDQLSLGTTTKEEGGGGAIRCELRANPHLPDSRRAELSFDIHCMLFLQGLAG